MKQEVRERAASALAGTAIIAARAPKGVKRNGDIGQDPMVLAARIVRNAFVNVNNPARAPMVRAPLSINRLMPCPMPRVWVYS